MPDQNHNLDPFQSFQKEADDVPKLSPDEVRRLGDRRRTTRRVGVVGGVAAAAVVAVTAVALNLPRSIDADPEIAHTATPSPTATSPRTTTQPTPTAPSTPAPTSSEPSTTTPPSTTETSTTGSQTTAPVITEQNLPSEQEIYLEAPGDTPAPLYLEGLSTASEEQTFFICDDGLADQPGIVAARSAIYQSGGMGNRAHLLQLDSPERALELAATIREWNATCPSRVQGNTGQPARAENETTITVNGAQVDFSVQTFNVTEEEGLWNGILVIVSGDRVLIIGDFVRGQDYNSVGPYLHGQDENLPLVPTARELETIIERMNG
ncbi:hypothetical protein ACPCG0_08720 [Propionibacteriaceae bacterium Y1923]|uniref:hypothetical protein n=1 Tax=Aestuariimicrobium sp. Y1814 TaxID=3418742 RepID=UPI003C264527